jgi:predicted GNAT family acetyltransferase
MALQIDLADDPAAFSAAVTPWLERHEAEHALFLGLLAAAVRQPPPTPLVMVRAATADGETAFAALRTDRNLIVSRGSDEALEATAAALARRAEALPGVVGPAREAERFAGAWAAARGCEARLAVAQRLYQLTAVSWPAPVAGEMRPIVPADLELVTTWAEGFDRDALPRDEWRDREVTREKMAKRIAAADMFGWVADGGLVSMAGLARPTARTISVNAVYTPPERRRRGFATALVAALSAEGLGRGKEACVLYTDLANPTSNAIYQKIGYRPVSDSRYYRFG